ncbi:site-specific DNA-methyltransferase [Oceanobacillus piezotolerans]|uniref:Site-specific DNA-methyltransferase n=1 Tax=Oceanobacillus piezotolerans TaxID=2448030 RepID=A0A498D638_9BACI|nr:site-specific DNA-methyltransferase [Oceanobacillus piezotolerans]RLL44916.1 site-specific DNA-methyltransferase [Oceanobacillus piezotolerans]
MKNISEVNNVPIQQKLKVIKEVFPELFTGSKIDMEKLQYMLGDHVESLPYELVWKGKQEARTEATQEPTKVLYPCISKSVNWDETRNLYIEGDNLETLRWLKQTHHHKIKMIYIDPPYNTGMDFIYHDTFMDPGLRTIQERLTSMHTNWLNFMYPRLMLACNLLTEDGMIFISIGDRELYNLKKMCDEIFGEDNFVTTLIWEKKKKPSFLDRNVGNVTEYIVVYSRNKGKTHALSLERTEKGKKYPFNNAGNPERVLTFPEGSVQFHLRDGIVKAQDMSRGKIRTELLDDVKIENGVNKHPFRLRGEWRYSQVKLNEIVQKGETISISKIPFRPNYVREGGGVKKLKNLFTLSGYGLPTYEDADRELTKLFGKKVFDYAKPVGLIRTLIESLLYGDDEAIVLDFFSGTGTTGEAVWQLNQTLRKRLSFILVQSPEEIHPKSEAYKEGYRTISELGMERLNRVREGLAHSGNKQDTGFRYYKFEN